VKVTTLEKVASTKRKRAKIVLRLAHTYPLGTKLAPKRYPATWLDLSLKQVFEPVEIEKVPGWNNLSTQLLQKKLPFLHA